MKLELLLYIYQLKVLLVKLMKITKKKLKNKFLSVGFSVHLKKSSYPHLERPNQTQHNQRIEHQEYEPEGEKKCQNQ